MPTIALSVRSDCVFDYPSDPDKYVKGMFAVRSPPRKSETSLVSPPSRPRRLLADISRRRAGLPRQLHGENRSSVPSRPTKADMYRLEHVAVPKKASCLGFFRHGSPHIFSR